MERPYSFSTVAAGLLLAIAPHAHGQGSGFANLSNGTVNARFNAWGLLGMNPATGNAAFEVPVGGGNHPLFSSALWVAGTDANNQLHVAAAMYESPADGDFWTGPLTNDGTASTTPAVAAAYDQVWCVTKAEVDLQNAYFSCLEDPNCDAAVQFPGFQVPASFFGWPGNGDVSAAQDFVQAPYFDRNLDGVYEPADGDAPCIQGDKACFMTYNDAKVHTLTATPPLGLHLRMMPFVYLAGNAALANTVFVRVHLVNQSTMTYTDARVGLFTDFDLGNAFDDLVGTDAARNLIYAYNGDNLDETWSGGPGYGTEPPACGAVLLRGPRLDPNGLDDAAGNTMPAWNGTGFGDQVVDNERFGWSWTRATYSNPLQGPPTNAVEFSNWLGGAWNNGVPQTYGGAGYSTGTVPARFIYPGGSDPAGVGTGGQPQAPWTELSAGNMPFDRKMVGVMGPFTLEPGEHVDLLFAYVYARAASGGPTASIAALQQRVDSVRAFAQDGGLLADAFEFELCAGVATGVPVAGEMALGSLLFHPVPAAMDVQVTVPDVLMGEVMVVHDAIGRVVATQPLVGGRNVIDVSRLSAGVYIATANTPTTRYTGRLVKE